MVSLPLPVANTRAGQAGRAEWPRRTCPEGTEGPTWLDVETSPADLSTAFPAPVISNRRIDLCLNVSEEDRF